MFRPLRRRISTSQHGCALAERLKPGRWRLEATVSDMVDVQIRIRSCRAHLAALCREYSDTQGVVDDAIGECRAKA